jgi:hypothetical protein
MQAAFINVLLLLLLLLLLLSSSSSSIYVCLSYAGSNSTNNEKNPTNILLKRMSRLPSSAARQLSLNVADDAGDLCSTSAVSRDTIKGTDWSCDQLDLGTERFLIRNIICSKPTANSSRTKLQNWFIYTDVKLEYDIDITLNCTKNRYREILLCE